MNTKFLIIAFVLSTVASLAPVKAQNTFYGDGAGPLYGNSLRRFKK